MTLHRLEAEDATQYVFRFKLFNGQEYNFVAPTMELAFVKFQKHASYEPKILAATQISKLDG